MTDNLPKQCVVEKYYLDKIIFPGFDYKTVNINIKKTSWVYIPIKLLLFST